MLPAYVLLLALVTCVPALIAADLARLPTVTALLVPAVTSAEPVRLVQLAQAAQTAVAAADSPATDVTARPVMDLVRLI